MATPNCGIFATPRESFRASTLDADFCAPMSRSYNTATTKDTGGVQNMSIETVLLIVILTFGLGFVLNRWDLGRSRFRRRSLRGGVWGRRRA
jgi:hypothetical protein